MTDSKMSREDPRGLGSTTEGRPTAVDGGGFAGANPLLSATKESLSARKECLSAMKESVGERSA